MDYKSALGVLTIVIAVVSYVPYFRDIAKGKTKPHAFSWLVWGVLTTIGFFGQQVAHGGAGAWVTGFTALACFTVFLFALYRGEKQITLSDWLSLLGAGVALFFWYITHGPLLAVILVTLIDALGFYPTFRKSYTKPHEETLVTYLLSSIKFAIALVALDHFTLVTALYPASLVVMNGSFVLLLALRRRR